MTADLGPAARREMWCVCGTPHRGPCTRCVLVDAAPPRPIPTLEDRMTAPDRIPVDCIRLGCGRTADQHHRMAGGTADTRSQDRAIRELTAERDEAREQAADAAYAAQQARKAVTQLRAELATEHRERTESEAWGRRLRTELTKAQNERNAAIRTIAAIRHARAHRCNHHCTEGGCDFDLAGFVDRVDDILAPPPLGSPADRAQDERPDCPTCSGPVRSILGPAERAEG